MKVIIQARQMQLTEALRQYCYAHVVAHVLRFYDNPAARIEFQLFGTGRAHAQEVHIDFHMPGAAALHVEERTDDAYRSLDLAGARLVRRIKEQIDRMRQPTSHGPIDHPLGRSAAAAERQLASREDDSELSPPRLPHLDEPVPSGR